MKAAWLGLERWAQWSQDPVQSGDRPQPSCLGSAGPRARLLGKLRRMILSSNYPSHDPDPGVAPAVTSLATRSHQAPGDNAPGMVSLSLSQGCHSQIELWLMFAWMGAMIPMIALSFAIKLLLKQKLMTLFLFASISLVRFFEIHHHEMKYVFRINIYCLLSFLHQPQVSLSLSYSYV